jgi:hypothetical protein
VSRHHLKLDWSLFALFAKQVVVDDLIHDFEGLNEPRRCHQLVQAGVRQECLLVTYLAQLHDCSLFYWVELVICWDSLEHLCNKKVGKRKEFVKVELLFLL